MEINRELLTNLGHKQGLINKEHIEKSWMQDHLLYYLAKKNDNLIFKGGTALYKLYNLPRFSEDLDFSSKEEINKDILKEFCEMHNCKLKYKKMRDSHLFKLRFPGILTRENTLRVDISVTKSLYGFDVKSYISPYPDITPFLIKVMSLQEILSEKIHGLLNRTKARDLYDLFFILRNLETKGSKEIIIKKLYDRNIIIEEKNLLREIEKRIKLVAPLWEEELRYFVLQELPDFKLVSNYVLVRLAEL